jgi:serine/threonine protein kinase
MSKNTERYQRDEENVLGKGGMGVVYKVLDTWTNEWVALKIMTGYPDDDERDKKARERFKREVKFARELKHDHILPAIDAGYIEHKGRRLPYLASPYMQDGSLATFMQKFPPCATWSLIQTADVILQAAQGLQYMHDRKPPKVHQDVKPANFIVRYIGRPDRIAHIYLSDFGITREQLSPLDEASEVIVTSRYMAPEQLDKIITCSSDEYSLAVLACYLLTNKFPFRSLNGTDTGFIRAHISGTPAPPSQLNPARVSSSKVDNVILKALNKEPEDRYESILQFAQELQDAITQEAQPDALTEMFSASSTETQNGSASSIAKEPGQYAYAPPVDNSAYQPITLNPPSIQPPPFLGKGQQIADTSPSSTATVRRKAPTVLQSFTPRWSKALPERPRMLSWSNDGETLICTFFSNAPRLYARDGRERVLQACGKARAACWSPNGGKLAVSKQNASLSDARSLVQIWDVRTPDQLLLTLPFQAREIEGIDWSKNHQLAVWAENQILLYSLPLRFSAQIDLAISRTLSIPTMLCGNTGSLRWSPDGLWLAAGAKNGEFVCWNGRTQTPHLALPPTDQMIYSLAWSLDSVYLTIAWKDNRVEVWHIPENRKITSWNDLPLVPRMLSVSNRGRVVIASSTYELLFGNLNDTDPTGIFGGHWLAAWSPTRPELASMNTPTGTELILWEEPKI